MITNFLGALSQKEDDFSGIINKLWEYFDFRRSRSLVLKIKGILNKVCLHQSIHVMIYPQEEICIHYIPKGTFASRHTYNGTFTSWHTHKGAFASWHPYKKHLHHDIPIRRHLHHKILHLHLGKETFASRLDMCVGTIMDKICNRIPAWDICIMKIASLKRDMCIIWTFRICINVKSICIENENLDLHHVLFAFIEDWHLGQ